MNLKVEYDRDYFIVQINGTPVNRCGLKSDTECVINVGDVLRISTTYARNWFVNDKAIGLQDAEDDAMYQNVYTMITKDLGRDVRLSVSLRKDAANGLDGDYIPLSVADAKIECPFEWRFFKSLSVPRKRDIELFKDACEIWDFGEYVRQLDNISLKFKRLHRLEDYYGFVNVCGIIKDNGKYLWIETGDGTTIDIVKGVYGSLSELTSLVPVDFLGMKPVPSFR